MESLASSSAGLQDKPQIDLPLPPWGISLREETPLALLRWAMPPQGPPHGVAYWGRETPRQPWPTVTDAARARDPRRRLSFSSPPLVVPQGVPLINPKEELLPAEDEFEVLDVKEEKEDSADDVPPLVVDESAGQETSPLPDVSNVFSQLPNLLRESAARFSAYEEGETPPLEDGEIPPWSSFSSTEEVIPVVAPVTGDVITISSSEEGPSSVNVRAMTLLEKLRAMERRPEQAAKEDEVVYLPPSPGASGGSWGSSTSPARGGCSTPPPPGTRYVGLAPSTPRPPSPQDPRTPRHDAARKQARQEAKAARRERRLKKAARAKDREAREHRALEKDRDRLDSLQRLLICEELAESMLLAAQEKPPSPPASSPSPPPLRKKRRMSPDLDKGRNPSPPSSRTSPTDPRERSGSVGTSHTALWSRRPIWEARPRSCSRSSSRDGARARSRSRSPIKSKVRPHSRHRSPTRARDRPRPWSYGHKKRKSPPRSSRPGSRGARPERRDRRSSPRRRPDLSSPTLGRLAPFGRSFTSAFSG